MKVLLNILLLLNCAVFSVFAQKQLPPPRALIYNAPDTKELKEFTSTENNFKAIFPGIPKVNKQDWEKVSVTSFRIYRQGSNTILNVYEFKNDLEQIKEKGYELLKTSLLKTPDAKFEAERDVQTNGIGAKEFDFLVGLQFQRIRVLIVGNRVYELKNDVTNWHILSKYNKEKVADFERETTRFFESFKLLVLPTPEVIPTPDEFLGELDNKTYRNGFFGFEIALPEDWHQFDPEEIEATKNLGLESLKTNKEKFDNAFEDAAKKEMIIFAVANSGNSDGTRNNLVFGIMRQPNSKVSSEQVLNVSKKFLLNNPKFRLIKDVQTFEIQGQQFSTISFETSLGGQVVYQKLLSTMRKGYSLSFVMTYFDEDGLKSLEKVFNTIKFKNK